MKDKVCGPGYSSAWTLPSSHILGSWTDEIICFVDRTADSDPPPRYYFTKDRLNSTRELINASATVMTSYDYDVWGTPTESHVSGDVSTRYRFSASETSDRAGLAWLGAVYPIPYDAEYVRWIASDQRWMRTSYIRPTEWAAVYPDLRLGGRYLPSESELDQVERLCNGTRCLLEGCFNEVVDPCGAEEEPGNPWLRYCMRCCVCAQGACDEGKGGEKYTGEGSSVYCPMSCCLQYNKRGCNQPCKDWGGCMRYACVFVGETPVQDFWRLGVPLKICRYVCEDLDGRLKWEKKDCAPCESSRLCWPMVWTDTKNCCR